MLCHYFYGNNTFPIIFHKIGAAIKKVKVAPFKKLGDTFSCPIKTKNL